MLSYLSQRKVKKGFVMKKLLLIMLFITGSLTVAADEEKAKTTNWTYTGATGAEHWGDLSPDFITCKTGKNQSPINISSYTTDVKLPAISFKYNMLTADKIINTGNSIQVNMWSGSGGEITVDGEVFKLKDFYFHTPSENTIDGQHAPLEAQFMHVNKAGEIAVIAILFEPGAADRTLASLIKHMPMDKGQEEDVDADALDHMQGEFESKQYFRFNGSLTTPPCTEGVRWIVMKRPMTISKEQLEMFQKALKRPNARPVQALNARLVAQ